MWWTYALIAVFGALALAFAWIMLRTMSMMKAGLALMLSSVGVAGLLLLLHADVLAAMTVMMFGPAMTGMIIFMLMLMEDSGGFMMTGSEKVPARGGPDVEPEVLAQADGLLAPIDAIAPNRIRHGHGHDQRLHALRRPLSARIFCNLRSGDFLDAVPRLTVAAAAASTARDRIGAPGQVHDRL